MTFTELPQRWKISIGGQSHELTLTEIVRLRSACDDVLEHRSGAVESVIAAICKQFGMEKFELLSKERTNQRCLARWCAWTLLSKHGMSAAEIARQFGKDHGTVLCGIKRLGDLAETNKHIRRQVAPLLKFQDRKA